MCTKKIRFSLMMLSFISIAVAQCNIVENSGLQFSCLLGQYYGCNSIAQLSVYCSASTPIRITLNQGVSNNYVPRQLHDIEQNLSVDYNIYLDANQNQIFGDGVTQGTSNISATCSGSCNYTLYGLILSYKVKAGHYSDTMVLMVNY